MVQLTEEKMAHIKELRKKAMKLPLHPGVYIMHSRDDTIIYIGKAKALKNRVSQYFGSDKNHNEKVRRMVSNVEYFEYILTDSEFEALILESSLIKQHQPKYNILLKDDKGYSYIKVTAGDWPRISETKQVLNDGAKYIGPYLSAWTIKDTVRRRGRFFVCRPARANSRRRSAAAPVPQLLHQAVLCPMPRAREPKGIQRGRAGGA